MGPVTAHNVTSGLGVFGIRNTMTLKSAIQDVKDTTLSAVSGLLGKLAYLASLRHKQGSYQHWGIENVYGPEASERALKALHADILKGVLRTSLPLLEEDLQVSCRAGGLDAGTYIERLRARFEDLLPEGRQDSPAAQHLSSVLLALSRLEKNPAGATRLTS
jgi:hypothetical protein